MAKWINGVRSAMKMIEDVEECMNDNCVYFHDVTLFPFRSNGGRSNGVTAVFEYKHKNERKSIGVSVYEHWNSDDICLKIDQYVPMNMNESHDSPSVTFGQDQLQEAVYAIQIFLFLYFKIPFPKEWYVPHGFKGVGTYLIQETLNYVDNKMAQVIADWCEPPEDNNEQ